MVATKKIKCRPVGGMSMGRILMPARVSGGDPDESNERDERRKQSDVALFESRGRGDDEAG